MSNQSLDGDEILNIRYVPDVFCACDTSDTRADLMGAA